jgi:hypothetical protein
MDNQDDLGLDEYIKFPNLVECFHIDLDKRNLLIIQFQEDKMSTEDLIAFQDVIRNLREALNKWIREENSPLYVLAISDNLEIRLEKVKDKGLNNG